MKYTLIFLLLFTSLYAKSSDFSLIINKPFNDALFDITEDYDRKISAVGFTKNFETKSSFNQRTYSDAFDYLQSASQKNGSQISLVKVDNLGNIVLNKTTNLSRMNEAVSVIKTVSNGYIVGGNTKDGSLLILKLDSSANTIYEKIFSSKNYDKMSKLILLKDGGVLAVGSSSTTRSNSGNLFQSGLGLNDIYLTRFSKNGMKLWSKKYGTSHDDKGIDAVEADDGTLIVLGETSYKNSKNMTLMRTSQSGDKIWFKHYESQESVTPYRIIKLRDKNFLVSLSQQNELQTEQIRLIKFDLQDNIIVDKSIGTTYSSVLKDIKEFSDGRLIGVGFVQDAYNTDALVMVLNNRLSLLNQEHYGEENFDEFNALTILHNSQVAVAGIHTDNTSQESNMWILKLNRNGTIAQKSNIQKAKQNHNKIMLSKSIDFYSELLKIFKDEIATNRISIKKDLTISFIDKSLLFKVSKYKLNSNQKIFIDNFSKKLMPFLNTHRTGINTLAINGHTSSEWGGATFTDKYLKNSKLSMNRAYSTLGYIFKKQNQGTQEWLSRVLRGSGFSYSKKVMFNKVENQDLSRRVSFKIILN